MIDHYAISGLLTAISVFLLGAFVLYQNTGARVNRHFSLLSVSISWWSLGLYLHATSVSRPWVLLWGRFLHIGAIFIPIFLYNLVVILVGKDQRKRRAMSVLYAIGLFFALLDLTPLFISGASPKHGYAYWVDPGILYPPHVVLTVALVLMSAWELFIKYRSSRGMVKNQMLYFLIAVLVGYGGGGLNYLLNYNISIFSISPYINYAILFYVAFTAYAIVTTRLMDIEVVIKRGVVYSSVAIVLSVIYFMVAYWTELLFFKFTGYKGFWTAAPSILTISLLFQPARDRIQKAVDRMMFRQRYMYQRVLDRYSHTLTKPTTDTSRLAKLAPYMVAKSMKLSGASLFILNGGEGRYEMRGGEGSMRSLIGYKVEQNSDLIELINRRKRTIVKDELDGLLESTKLFPDEKRKLKNATVQLDDLGCVLVIPLISESEYFGKPTLLSMFCLGEKISGDLFSADDISFLETMADQATITIEYAIILDELERSRKRLIQAEKLAALGTMAAGVAHEIKNPLAALKLFTEVIPQKFDDPDYRNKFATLIPSELNRLKTILSDLDTFSKPEVEARIGPFSVGEVIDKTIQLLSVQLKKSSVRIEQDIADDPRISGSSSKLMQVFLNIMINAVHAMEGGGRLKIEASAQGPKVVVVISDTGSGISKENLKNIFNPFFTTKETGTGLGLAITRRIVEEHNGTIEVGSEVGKGTKFTLSFPIA
jgi:signal transduction histidine kinase